MDEEGLLKSIGGLLFAFILIIASGWYFLGKMEEQPFPDIRKDKPYLITRETGSARHLYGRCLLVHLFVESKDAERWTKKGKLGVVKGVATAKSWMQERASEYQVGRMEFIDEIVYLDKQFSVKRLILPEFDKKVHSTYLKEWYKILIRSLGYDSWEGFISNRKYKYNVENVALLLHINYAGRSYATFHGIAEPESMVEYTVLFIKDKSGYRVYHAPIYAHEIFHLFGADDLYNIKGAEKYYLDGIMHNTWGNIRNIKVSPLTAYAISWTNEKPVITDFEVSELN